PGRGSRAIEARFPRVGTRKGLRIEGFATPGGCPAPGKSEAPAMERTGASRPAADPTRKWDAGLARTDRGRRERFRAAAAPARRRDRANPGNQGLPAVAAQFWRLLYFCGFAGGICTGRIVAALLGKSRKLNR